MCNFRPSRGDLVETWLKRSRDVFNRGTQDWYRLNTVLDDYRYCADTGTALDQDAEVEMLDQRAGHGEIWLDVEPG